MSREDELSVQRNVTIGPCELHIPLSWSESCAARTVKVDADAIWIELDGAKALPAKGDRVILDGPWKVRVLGTVARLDQGRVCVSVSRAVEKDRRGAQRSVGGVDLRYQVAMDPADADRWVEQGEASVGPWHVPDPFMSFSSTGLRFEHRAVVEAGDLLLLSLALPQRAEVWRGTAHVVRVNDIPSDEQGVYLEGEPPATHRIAVHFDRLSTPARDALVARGLEILRAIRKSS